MDNENNGNDGPNARYFIREPPLSQLNERHHRHRDRVELEYHLMLITTDGVLSCIYVTEESVGI